MVHLKGSFLIKNLRNIKYTTSCRCSFMNWLLSEYVGKMGLHLYKRVTSYYMLKFSQLICAETPSSEYSYVTSHCLNILYSTSSHSSLLIWQRIILMMSTGCTCACVRVCTRIYVRVWLWLYVSVFSWASVSVLGRRQKGLCGIAASLIKADVEKRKEE